MRIKKMAFFFNFFSRGGCSNLPPPPTHPCLAHLKKKKVWVRVCFFGLLVLLWSALYDCLKAISVSVFVLFSASAFLSKAEGASARATRTIYSSLTFLSDDGVVI